MRRKLRCASFDFSKVPGLSRLFASMTGFMALHAWVASDIDPSELARELGLTRTNVSNHLSCLRGCGIVVAKPSGRQTRYELVDPHLAAALRVLVDTTLAVDQNAVCIDPSCAVPGCCGQEGA